MATSNLLHTYLIHLGAWYTALIGLTVYRQGLPLSWKPLKKLILAAALLSALGAFASSTSHVHYLKYLKDVPK